MILCKCRSKFNAQPQTSALEGGSLDAAVNISLRDAWRLQTTSGYQVILNKNSGALYVIQPNTTLDPTSNKLLWQAIQYGIDRQRIADTVLPKLGDPTELPWFHHLAGLRRRQEPDVRV